MRPIKFYFNYKTWLIKYFMLWLTNMSTSDRYLKLTFCHFIKILKGTIKTQRNTI